MLTGEHSLGGWPEAWHWIWTSVTWDMSRMNGCFGILQGWGAHWNTLGSPWLQTQRLHPYSPPCTPLLSGIRKLEFISFICCNFSILHPSCIKKQIESKQNKTNLSPPLCIMLIPTKNPFPFPPNLSNALALTRRIKKIGFLVTWPFKNTGWTFAWFWFSPFLNNQHKMASQFKNLSR